MSQGRAIYSMEISHYDETPKSVSEAIIEKVKGKDAVPA
jgi:elongation factor G